MASPGFVIPIAVALSLVLVSHRPYAAASDFLSPLLAPIFENVCKGVPCGKGSCRHTENSLTQFECVCDPGWKQPFSGDGFQFLPCVIPNCTINYSCSPSSSPTPSPAPISASATNRDVCSWNNFCGGGTCNRSSSSNSSSYSYSCSCSEGYTNIMNSSSFPCLRDCGIGGDCHHLGLTLFNQTARTPATSAVENTTNNAGSLQFRNLSWFTLVLVMFA